MLYVALPIIALGHMAIHVAFINRLHGTALPRKVLKSVDALWYVLMAGIPLLLGVWYLRQVVAGTAPDVTRPSSWLALGYLALCCLTAGWAIADRIFTLRNIKTTELLVGNHTREVSIKEQLGHAPASTWLTALFANLPGNEILDLSVHEKTLVIPRLEAGLSGLRITHLSDLHLTGQLSPSFYREVVRQANEWDSDIVAITGDIVEKAACLDWIADTLGPLRAKYGVYFVLGNHELKIRNEARVRATLTDAGLIDLGKQWKMLEHKGQPFVLLGNELPWFKPAADMASCPTEVAGVRPLRIMLTHSPDQLAWARRNDCDLMLAGHTHGGQVRLPLIGPILSPSLQGSRFASGTFYYSPTLMHVSRGIAGTRPVRWNCPPELARLVLTTS